MATITAAAGGGNFTTGGTWVGGVAPTSADDAVLDASSGNVTVDSGAVCRSLDCNGYTGTLNIDQTLTTGDGSPGAGNIALRFSSGMTISGFGAVLFSSTSGTQQSIISAGKSFPLNVSVNGNGGNYALGDNMTVAGQLTLAFGSFNANGHDVTAAIVSSNFSNTRTVTLGSGTWTVNSGVSTAPWNFSTTTGLTFSGASATIVVPAGSSTKNFHGGGLTYGTLQIGAGSAGLVQITGSNTFSKLERSGTGAKSVRFTAGGTTTLTGGDDAFFGTGDGANQWTIDTSSSGSAATIASGTNLICDWLSLKDITGPAGTNYAGANSTNVSGNTNWTFTGPTPAPTLSSIDPTSGTVAGGTEVTLTGTDLTGTTGVTFGGDSATSVTVVNDTTVTCVTPAHAAGAVDVVLTTPGGSDTLVGGFTFADVTAPTAASWATNTDGNEITATLSESGCTPASGTGGFTLGGTSATVASWAISGTTLTLTLSGTVYQGQTVTISYNDATASEAIADGAANLLADIAAAAVTNNSTTEPPPTTSGSTFSNCVLMVNSFSG